MSSSLRLASKVDFFLISQFVVLIPVYILFDN